MGSNTFCGSTTMVLAAALLAAPRAQTSGWAALKTRSARMGTAVVAATFTDLNGASHPLRRSGGRPAVFLFLATECPIANVYTPRLRALEKRYSPRGVRFFGVYANGHESAAVVRRHARERGYRFPIIKDDGTLVRRLGATMTPEAVLLDGKGVLRYRGRIDDDKDPERARSHDLRAALDAVLAGRTVARAEAPAFGCIIQVEPPGGRVKAAKVTFAQDVAPILQRHCVECHRAGEVAPFALEKYEQAAVWARAIQAYTRDRRMPPWKARSHGEFHDERRLTEREIATLAAWADAGAPQGDRSDLPPRPKFRTGWKLDRPDVVVKLPEAYTLGPDGKDIYQCFVIPTSYKADRWVSAIEVQPGNRRVVHHVIVYLDTSGAARKLDAADPGPGYTNPTPGSGPGFDGALMLGGWAPGNEPRRLPPGTGRRLPKGADLVVEVHYHKSGKLEKDRTQFGMYFVQGPVKQRVQTGILINQTFRIPPGDPDHVVRASHSVPDDITVLNLLPHMHMIGRLMKLTATLPDGTEQRLIDVPDWDFNWQLTYVYKEPVKLPKGSRIDLEARYDNSTQNPNNPHRPPQEMRWGPQTTDEMCLAFFEFTLDHEDLTKPGALASRDGPGHSERAP